MSGLCANSRSRVNEFSSSDQMLDAKKQLAAARTERGKAFYENKCATLDRQIDSLVYELYELTPEEIAIVEGSGPYPRFVNMLRLQISIL